MKLTESKVIEVLESVFRQKKGSIKATTNLEDFAKDSMDVMEFIAILKNEYNVAIDPSAVSTLSTVQEIIDYAITHQELPTS
jgi:acyl carrier protein